LRSIDSTSQKFDLTEVSQTLWVKWLRGRWIMGIALVLAGFILAAASLYRALSASLAGNYLYVGRPDLVLFGFFFAWGIVAWWSQHNVSKPANAVIVSREGIEFQFPTFRPKVLAWSNPSFRLRSSPLRSANLGREVHCSQFWWKPRAYMPEDVVVAITAAARAHGLDVQSVKDPNSVTGEGMVIRATRPPAR
jgi:hypothetical protein